MSESDPIQVIEDHIIDHVNSPSLRHIRDISVIHKVARKIIHDLDSSCSFWTKWTVPRTELLTTAAECSIPAEDIRGFLNKLPGPELTLTDVSQRLRIMFEEDGYLRYPTEEMKRESQSIYADEKSQGTELPAIIGLIREYIDRVRDQKRIQDEAGRQALQERERAELEERFLSGADCKWVSVDGSKELYCRANGQAYFLSKSSDKTRNLYRINSIEDQNRTLVGNYRNLEAANKALTQDVRWLEQKR